MKNIYYFIAMLILGSSEMVMAQWEGQKFISGTGSVVFSNNNPDVLRSSNSYGYNFNVGLGKFKTSTRASGWNLNTSLSGSKQSFTTYNNGTTKEDDKNGINGFGVGAGHFWQFYKHFNDKVGIYAGPDINARYDNTKNYSTTNDNSTLVKNTTAAVTLSAGVSAGLYYKLSEKWWITSNIALSNFVSTSYASTKSGAINDNSSTHQKTFNYEFTPSFRFPSVGFGLRYFIK